MRRALNPQLGAIYGTVVGVVLTLATLAIGTHLDEPYGFEEVLLAPPLVGALVGWLLVKVHQLGERSIVDAVRRQPRR